MTIMQNPETNSQKKVPPLRKEGTFFYIKNAVNAPAFYSGYDAD